MSSDWGKYQQFSTEDEYQKVDRRSDENDVNVCWCGLQDKHVDVETSEYVKQNNIAEMMSSLCQALQTDKPMDPAMYLIGVLRGMTLQQKGRGVSPTKARESQTQPFLGMDSDDTILNESNKTDYRRQSAVFSPTTTLRQAKEQSTHLSTPAKQNQHVMLVGSDDDDDDRHHHHHDNTSDSYSDSDSDANQTSLLQQSSQSPLQKSKQKSKNRQQKRNVLALDNNDDSDDSKNTNKMNLLSKEISQISNADVSHDTNKDIKRDHRKEEDNDDEEDDDDDEISLRALLGN